MICVMLPASVPSLGVELVWRMVVSAIWGLTPDRVMKNGAERESLNSQLWTLNS